MWDEELGHTGREDDPVDEMKVEWRRHLDWLEISAKMVMPWIKVEYEG